jgi:hypothetical protein
MRDQGSLGVLLRLEPPAPPLAACLHPVDATVDLDLQGKTGQVGTEDVGTARDVDPLIRQHTEDQRNVRSPQSSG